MNMKNGRAAILSAALSVIGTAHSADGNADVMTDAQKADLQNTIVTCGACHGVHGLSISPTFPDLAGQKAPYIERQLKAFKDHSRADPDAQAYMWGMASQLSDAEISGVAAYFSAQPGPSGTPGDPKLIAEGKHLFELGDTSHGIPPCASCHGPKAEGMEMDGPRLAGQHTAYLYKQLIVIQSALRTAPVMHGVVKDMTKDQMKAVIAYLGSI